LYEHWSEAMGEDPFDGLLEQDETIVFSEEGTLHADMKLGMPLGDGDPCHVAVTNQGLLFRFVDESREAIRLPYSTITKPLLRRSRSGLSQSSVQGILEIGLPTDRVYFWVRRRDREWTTQSWSRAELLISHFLRAWDSFHSPHGSHPSSVAAPPSSIPWIHNRIEWFLRITDARWNGGPVYINPHGSGPYGASYTFQLAGLPVYLTIRDLGPRGLGLVVSAPVLEGINLGSITDVTFLRLAARRDELSGLLRVVHTGARPDLLAVETIAATTLTAADLALAVHAVHRAAVHGYAQRHNVGGLPPMSQGGAPNGNWHEDTTASLPRATWPDALMGGDRELRMAGLLSSLEALGIDGQGHPTLAEGIAMRGSYIRPAAVGNLECAVVSFPLSEPTPVKRLPRGVGRDLVVDPLGPLDLCFNPLPSFLSDDDLGEAGTWLERRALVAFYEGMQASLEANLHRLVMDDPKRLPIIQSFS
jgi:hypothetical protein